MTRKDSQFAIGNLFHLKPRLCGTREMESLSPPRLKQYERAVMYKAISNLNASLLGLPLRQPDVAEPQLLYTHFCDISSPSILWQILYSNNPALSGWSLRGVACVPL